MTPPVFVLGAPRSGTSLVYKALCLHPDAGWISNWVRRFPSLPALALLNRAAASFPERRRSVWFGAGRANAYVYGKQRSLGDRAFPMPVEGETVFRRCGLGDGIADRDRYGDSTAMLRRTFETVCRYGTGQPLVSKCITNNRRLPVLRTAFPEARFIDVIRDGRAVAYSLSRVDWWPDSTVWWCGGTPRDWESSGGEPWELCARHWVEELRVIEDGLRGVSADRVFHLSYEQLLRDPIATLADVARFSGLTPHSRWMSELSSLNFPNQNERWKRTLVDDAVHIINSIQKQKLTEHGYLT